MIRVTRAFALTLAMHPPSALVNVLSVLSWLSVGTGYEVSKAAAWSATNAIRLRLRDQATTVIAVRVASMDTAMTAGLEVPKANPSDIASQVADAIASGASEVLADDTTRMVKSKLSEDLSALYALRGVRHWRPGTAITLPTESILRSLPPVKTGAGSALNDATRGSDESGRSRRSPVHLGTTGRHRPPSRRSGREK